MNFYHMQYGEKIKKIRDLKGLRQEEMAGLLNISPQAYSKIERNETKLDEERMEQIAKIFGISAEDIKSFDDRNLFVNNQKDFESKQSTGLANTVNNYYYGNDHSISIMEKIMEQQRQQLQEQKEEIIFLRKQLETILNKK